MSGNRPVTFGWLVYRIVDSKLEVMGLSQTEDKARADVAAVPQMGFSIMQVMFMGWGEVAPGVFSQNGRPPLKLVDKKETE